MLSMSGQTDRLNWLTFFEETHGCPGVGQRLKEVRFCFPQKILFFVK